MEVQQIEVLQLHELQDFLHLSLDTLSFQVEQFGGDEQLFSFNSTFRDDCLYRLAESNLIVVNASAIDVLAVSELQSLPQQVSQLAFVSERVSAEALQRHHLFVRKSFEGRALFLLGFFVSHICSYIMTVISGGIGGCGLLSVVGLSYVRFLPFQLVCSSDSP